MTAESQPLHHMGFPSRSQHDEAQHNVHHHLSDRSSLGPGPSPSHPLQGPGQAGPLSPNPPYPPVPPASRKRKRTTHTDPAQVGGYGPIPGSPGVQTERSTPQPSPTINFTERKNSAYEIWAFTRAVKTNDDVPAGQWTDDYDNYLTSRPGTLFVGCKFCTQFGNHKGVKVWKVYCNGPQTSPTSTLRSHFRSEHSDVWESECCRLDVPRNGIKRQKLGWDGTPFTYDEFVMRLQRFIVGDDQSIYVIDNPYFRDLLLYLGQGQISEDDIPKRTYLTESIIKAWKKDQGQFHEEMKSSLGRISLTVDAWSSPTLVSFFGVTAHFIVHDKQNGQLILRSGLLAFRHLQGTHTGEHLAEVLYSIIKGAGIQQRIGSITADNASNNNTMMEYLEAWFKGDNIPFDRHGNRVRCFPHVINLAVQAIYAALKDGKGLDELYLLGGGHINKAAVEHMVLPHGVTRDDYRKVLEGDIIGTARKLIGACRASGNRREEFFDTIFEGNLNGTWTDNEGNSFSRDALQLLRDCETRWSSTFFMLDRVLVMLPVIKAFSQRPHLSDANLTMPNPAEVCVLDHVRSLTSVPHDAQESLSSSQTPTLSYSLPFYHSIINEWEHMKWIYPFLSPFIEIGVNKVETYIDKSKLSRTYLFAILLNPCLKMKWIEDNCPADDVQKTINMALETMLAFKKADLNAQHENLSAYTAVPTHHLKSVAASTQRFLDRNTSRTPPLTQPVDPVTSPSSPLYASISEQDMVQDGLRFELDEYLHEPRMASYKKVTQGSESEGYHVIAVWCDPLQYWRGAEKRFPYLFRLAADILPAQASAVACERLFSSSKETCTPRRNRISPDLMEALQMLKFSINSGALDLTKHVEDTFYLVD